MPRNLVFVTSAQPDLAPGELAHTTIMRTDPDMDGEAKLPWKGMRHEGHIDDRFLYATVLSKNLVPFGVRKLHLVALPLRVGIPAQVAATPGQTTAERFMPMALSEMRDAYSASVPHNPTSVARSADSWFAHVEQLWADNKKDTTKETLAEWVNYQNKITGQVASPGFIVLYGAAGSNISASLVDTSNLAVVNSVRPQGLVADYTTYWYRCDSPDEGYYLSALLNAPCVDAAIKPYQPRGIYVGPRHIQRRPFEVCPIRQYDPTNADHQALARLSADAHRAVAAVDLTHGGVVSARKRARQVARDYLDQIDAIAQRLLKLAAPPQGYATDEDGETEEVDAAVEA